MTNKERLQQNNAELRECIGLVVPGGGGGSRPNVKEKDVNFYDYDGTLLHSYTVEEAQALSELPELPTQEGLICQGWNWSLEDIKAHNRAVDVGATYITDDGKTRLYIKIAAEGRMDVRLYFYQSITNGVIIDWGDGSATETVDGKSWLDLPHKYASIGEYVISLDVTDGCELGLGRSSATYNVIGSTGELGYHAIYNMLKKVEIGKGVKSISSYTFLSCYSLASITIPNSVMNIRSHAFLECYSLSTIVIPNGVTIVNNYTFEKCYVLSTILIPNSVTNIGDYSFDYCYSLTNVEIPNSVTNINGYAFKDCSGLVSIVIPNSVRTVSANLFVNCRSMKFYDFSQHTSVPTLENSNVFYNIPSDCKIRVPMALVDEWKAATNWSTYADKIVGV